MKPDAMHTQSFHGGSGRAFWRHFAEMVVVMFASMAILGAAVSFVFSVLGHASVLHYAGLRGFLMSMYMVIGMAAWMRHRRHSWASVREMSTAMFVPYMVLIVPFAAGQISEAAFLGLMHLLMFPCMLAAMWHRRSEYSVDHRAHA